MCLIKRKLQLPVTFRQVEARFGNRAAHADANAKLSEVKVIPWNKEKLVRERKAGKREMKRNGKSGGLVAVEEREREGKQRVEINGIEKERV